MDLQAMNTRPPTEPTTPYVAEWVAREREYYAHLKYGDDLAFRQQMVESMEQSGLDNEWNNLVNQYFHRARLLGPDTLAGRQALAKFVVSALHCLETAVEVHGPLPEPGHPSGEIQEWNNG